MKNQMKKKTKAGFYSYLEFKAEGCQTPELVAVMMYDKDEGDFVVLPGMITQTNPDLHKFIGMVKVPFALKCQGTGHDIEPIRYGAGWLTVTPPLRVDYWDMDNKISKLFKNRVGVRFGLDTPAGSTMMAT